MGIVALHNKPDEYLPDVDLYRLIRGGDDRAFTDLQNKHRLTVLSAISKHLNNSSFGGTLSIGARTSQSDVAPTVWENIYEAIQTGKFVIENENSSRSFIKRVAQYKALNLIKDSETNRTTSGLVDLRNTFLKFEDLESNSELAVSENSDRHIDETTIFEHLIPLLNERELEVFNLMKEFYLDDRDDPEFKAKLTSVQMAESLGVNERTIRNHKKSIQLKLGRLKGRLYDE
jgi:hypothetical protein